MCVHSAIRRGAARGPYSELMAVPDPAEIQAVQLEKAIAALAPFVRAWSLPLNPENLSLMALAVLRYAPTDASFEDIDAGVRDMIATDHQDHLRMMEVMRADVDGRRETSLRDESP
jgi:hypothetical protein